MKIFSDIHHFDLFYSFQLLFEQRLGYDLYRPIGRDWYTEGYYQLSNDNELADCILSAEDGKAAEILSKYETLQGKDWAVFSLHLPRIGKIQDSGLGTYLIEDKSKDVWQKGITFEAFKDAKFDIIISSVPQHFHLFEQLRQKYQPQAFHIFHHAAIGWSIPDGAKNLMINSIPSGDLNKYNYVYYRQEFDTDIFKHTHNPINLNTVHSYVHFPQTEAIWNDIDLLDWDMKFVGKTLGPLKNVVVKSTELSKKINDAAFTLHIKIGGESYGHILHNSIAAGRPVIINRADFIGTAADELLTDGICFDVSKYSPADIKTRLIKCSRPDEWHILKEKTIQRFNQIVDFNEDAEKVKAFMERLI